MSPRDKVLIEAAELNELLKQDTDNIRLVDASYGGGSFGMTPHQGYQLEHIGDAAFFDIDQVADLDSDQPHMLPSAEFFQAEVSKMGISNDDTVVIYDQSGLYMAAARVWWMFKCFGHQDVRVLNGGLPNWKANGFEIETGPVYIKPGFYAAEKQGWRVVCKNGVMDCIGDSTKIIDARAEERFNGTAQEPREGMRAGHIPGSQCIPFMALLEMPSGRLKSADELKQIIGHLGEEDRVVSSCGSGVTACVLALAAASMGHDNVAVYDGSWSEWGQENSELPVAV